MLCQCLLELRENKLNIIKTFILQQLKMTVPTKQPFPYQQPAILFRYYLFGIQGQ